MDDEDNRSNKSNWSEVAITVSILIFVLVLCFGNRILDWMGAPS